MKSVSKKSRLSLLLILVIVTMIFSACSTPGVNITEEKTKTEVEASQTVNDLQQGISEGNENQIKNSLSNQGVEVTTETGTTTYTKENFITSYENNEELKQLFQIQENNVEGNDTEVIIRGETGLNLGAIPNISELAQNNYQSNLVNTLAQSNVVKNQMKQAVIKSRDQMSAAGSYGNYSGEYCNFEVPSSWRLISFEERIKNRLTEASDDSNLEQVLQDMNMDLTALSKQEDGGSIVGVVMHIEDETINFEQSGSLDSLTEEKLEQAEKKLTQGFNQTRMISNAKIEIIKNEIDNISAVKVKIDYDFTYNPSIVELRLEEENGRMVIKTINLREGDQKTVQMKGNLNLGMDQDRLILMYYVGYKDLYESSNHEIDNMKDSYDVLNNN